MSDAVLVTRPATPIKARLPRSAPAARSGRPSGLGAALVRPLERRLAPEPVGDFLDAVTGLLNRSGLERSLTSLIDASDAKRGVGAMLCVDLGGPDVLEGVAVAAGPAAADELLRAAARVLRQSVRGADAIGRLGGDDFVVVLEGLGDLANAARIAETMLFALRRMPLQAGAGLAPRIGVTRLPESACAVAAMFAARELALSGD
jgi:diguanylate cyclase (GGDEF)-like protein